MPDEILYERRAFPPEVAAGLRRRGHTLTERKTTMSDECAIGLDSEGRYTGAPDPRDEGVALGF
jgi:gamma-glutamyltranspeptidase/glutathione hydrolase